MKYFFLILSSHAFSLSEIFGSGEEEQLHPVRQEIIDEIQAKTKMWWPQTDMEQNPMSKIPSKMIKNSLGQKGLSGNSESVLAGVLSYIEEKMFGKVGFKGKNTPVV